MKYRFFLALIAAGSPLPGQSAAFAQSATRTQLITASPSRAGQAITMTAFVDAPAGAAPTGAVAFRDGATVLGSAALGAVGAGQATVSGGWRHSCALTNTGGVKCWGNNNFGQLGDGTTVARPTAVTPVGLTTGVIAVASGLAHSCALLQSGSVKCWGQNISGQLGNGTATNSLTPTPVSNLNRAVAITAGEAHSCALTSEGAVMCWGRNAQGQLGTGPSYSSYTPSVVGGPTEIYTAVSAGLNHSCALTRAGAVRCWGANESGEIGDGTKTNRVIPTPVVGLASGVAAIGAGGSHSCAVGGGGALRCWGDNFYGQVGDGGSGFGANRLTPVAVSGLSSGVAAVALGGDHSCVLMSNGQLRCWGRNLNGQLGDGTKTNRSTPGPVLTPGGAAVALSGGGEFSCAVLVNRVTRCWGGNNYGQVGDGTFVDRLLPTTTGGVVGMLRARARLTTPALTAGWHFFTANYGGDAGHLGSSANIGHLVQ